MRPGARPLAVRRAEPGERLALLLLAPAACWLGALFLYPLVRLLSLSLFAPAFTVRNYAKLLMTPVYHKILWNTFEVSLLVTGIALILAYPLAYLMVTASPRMAGLMLAGVMLPLWTSILVRTYAWMVLLGRRGIVNEALQAIGLLDAPLSILYNRLGVTIGMVHVLLPFMVLPLYSVMRGIDPSLLRAAQNLGAGARQAFLRVFLPLSLPGVAAGCLLVFASAIGFFITPALLGGRGDMMIAMLIENEIRELLNWEFAATLAVSLLVATGAILVVYDRFLGLDRLWGGAA